MVGVGAGWVLFEVDSPRVMPCQLGRMGVLGREAGQYHGGAGCLLWCEEQQSLE